MFSRHPPSPRQARQGVVVPSGGHPIFVGAADPPVAQRGQGWDRYDLHPIGCREAARQVQAQEPAGTSSLFLTLSRRPSRNLPQSRGPSPPFSPLPRGAYIISRVVLRASLLPAFIQGGRLRVLHAPGASGHQPLQQGHPCAGLPSGAASGHGRADGACREQLERRGGCSRGAIRGGILLEERVDVIGGRPYSECPICHGLLSA